MASTINCFGNIALDLVMLCNSYPEEDSEQRIEDVHQRVGGNVANTMDVLAQFTQNVCWYGMLPDNSVANDVIQQLNKKKIHLTVKRIARHYRLPTSYILLNKMNGSRTILHHRDMPEMCFNDFLALDYEKAQWCHFEVRNPDEQEKILKWIRKTNPDTRVSIEIEKYRKGFEKMVSIADYVFYSRKFAEHSGFSTANDFLKSVSHSDRVSFVAWGDGGAGFCKDDEVRWQNCQSIKAVDTIGAGDVFNAGLIESLLQNYTEADALKFAVELATKKCQQMGYQNLVMQSTSGPFE